jgi:hypothetical protein
VPRILRAPELSLLVLAASSLTACYTPSCATLLEPNVLTIDFSAVGRPAVDLEFEFDCPGESECFENSAGARLDAATQNAVEVWPGISNVHVVVYEKGGQSPIFEKNLEPVPWDPPTKPNSCPVPGKAVLKL